MLFEQRAAAMPLCEIPDPENWRFDLEDTESVPAANSTDAVALDGLSVEAVADHGLSLAHVVHDDSPVEAVVHEELFVAPTGTAVRGVDAVDDVIAPIARPPAWRQPMVRWTTRFVVAATMFAATAALTLLLNPVPVLASESNPPASSVTTPRKSNLVRVLDTAPVAEPTMPPVAEPPARPLEAQIRAQAKPHAAAPATHFTTHAHPPIKHAPKVCTGLACV
jgi:hypothetical protein